ncbi:MAG TPA: cache domain-containing protein, partial [Beijerinckiaceae bacterium]|nr:cache domain-containing protein [Beijerinckiaceae bacterium]
MRLRLGFQPSITTLFVTAVLFVGLTLVYLSFDRATSITRSAASTFVDRVAQHTTDRVETEFKMVIDLVTILGQLPTVESATISDNPRLYAILAAMLRNTPQLYSLYVGYDDGDFLEMDALERGSAAARAAMAAPEGAAFRVVVITRIGDGRIISRRFLSPELAVLARAEGPADYDPRERPWYRDAFEESAGVVTEPYVFGSGQVGYTARVPFEATRRGVVGGDILIGEIEAFLRDQKLGETGVAFLFDNPGRIVAHPRMSALLKGAAGPDGKLELPLLAAADVVNVTGPAVAWRGGGSAQQFFRSGERTYVAAFRTIDTARSAGLNLAVVAPLDEFFGEIEAARRSLFMVAIGFVAATLPVAVLIGWLLSGALRRIAVETDRIQRFDIDDDPRQVRSVIREIDDLGRSVATMRTVVRAFSSFVPKRLVQRLVETGDAFRLGGTRREVTVMFTDIVGFTAITENADPEQVMLYTSRYLAALSDAVMANGGTVDKFVGDAVMAIWNAPSDDPDHVVHACAGALACREANTAL